ncbi:Type IV leader peptidase family protein [compost metagenome]
MPIASIAPIHGKAAMFSVAAAANLSLVAMVIVAAVSDVRSRRIPNWLVAAGLALALVAQVATHGPADGALVWIGGAATGAVMLLAVYLMGGMGAGDVKLMGAVGAFMGVAGAAHVAVVGFLAGGALAIAALLLRRIAAARRAAARKPVRLPYGLAIATATLLVKWELF